MKCNVFVVTCLLAGSAGWAAEPLKIDSPMWRDPACQLPEFKTVIPQELVRPWKRALEFHDAELRRMAADTLVTARQRGMEGLEGLRGRLAELAGDQEAGPVVRRAAARALVALDSREHAELLARVAAAEGPEVAQLVEPALARWGYGGLASEWLKRLEDHSVPQVSWRLALDCLVIREERAAAEPLLKFVHDDRTPITLRLAAAKAVAALEQDGLVDDARRLASDKSTAAAPRRTLGVTLLRRHRDAESVTLLRELATDADPAVAAAAFERLLEIDPKHTYDLAAAALGNADVKVRSAAARALVAQGEASSVRQVSVLLADRNPTLRVWVRQSLVELAQRPELRRVVIEEMERSLDTHPWQGLEQAMMLAVSLEHAAIAGRLVEYMPHPRPEVALAACFALRKFRVPELLPPMLEHATKQQQRRLDGGGQSYETVMMDDQLIQLAQAFGEMRYEPADRLLRKFVPKVVPYGIHARAAACWALGYLHEGKAPADLVGQFQERLSDVASEMPEADEVRRMCAASMGRMRAESALPVLRRFCDGEGQFTDVGQSCWWSIELMTDEKRPPFIVYSRNLLGWFMQPTDKP
jgi:HEAT repeat protein